MHPQDSSKAAYVNRKGDVKRSLHEIDVPIVEQSVREDALEVQDIRELGLGWAWFVIINLRAFLRAWQDMELASLHPDELVTQIEADVPIAPILLQAECVDLELDLHSYERPLAPLALQKMSLSGTRHIPWPYVRDHSLFLANGFAQI